VALGLFDLDLDIDTGSIFIRPSGSGETTTVRLMTGVMAPDSGGVEVLEGDTTLRQGVC
jgi:ABC-2 type transport system ATP-binding protein